MDTKLYSITDLRTYLKSLGLPSSRPTILKYEKLGIIKTSRSKLPRVNGHEERVYIWAEIEEIGKIFKKKVTG